MRFFLHIYKFCRTFALITLKFYNYEKTIHSSYGTPRHYHPLGV